MRVHKAFSKRAAIVAASLLCSAAMLYAPGPAQAEPVTASSAIVARVGPVAITAEEVSWRLAQVPAFQLPSYGQTPDEIRRNFLERVVIPEALFAAAARQTNRDQQQDVRWRERDVLKNALLEKMRDQWADEAQVSAEEVAAYYEAHRDRYNSPERYSIWRILVPTKDKAAALIAELRADPTPQAWAKAAREHSTDKSTSMRSGNLGYVNADGVTADGRVRVAKELVDAVKAVRDGDIVDQPVAEGSSFAVVWRRGSMPAVSRTLADQQHVIRRQLGRERTHEAQKKFIEDLRQRSLRDVNSSLVNLITVTSQGQVEPQSKPGRIQRMPGRTTPETTMRGLR